MMEIVKEKRERSLMRGLKYAGVATVTLALPLLILGQTGLGMSCAIFGMLGAGLGLGYTGRIETERRFKKAGVELS